MVFKRAKIFILLFIVIFIFYFTSDFSLINIEKTAFIISLGIDKKEEEYEVTAQIAIPESAIGQPSNDESVISASGKTLYSAVSQIGEMTGWYPKLSFCNLIILGENMLNDNVFDMLDFFIRSYKVEDSAILCACYGSAKEILLSHSPLDNISGLSLSKIFVRDYNGANKILTTSIKQFSIGYYSRSHSGFMPIVNTVKIDKDAQSTTSTATMSEPSSGTSGKSEGDNKFVIYDASTALYFSKGFLKGKLTSDEAHCFALTIRNAKESYINVDSIDEDGKKGSFLFGIQKSLKNSTLSFDGDTPVLKLKVDVWLRITDTNFAESIQNASNLGKMSEKMLYDCKVFLTENLTSCFNKSKQDDCDLFELKNKCYRYFPKKYKKYGENILKDCKLNLTINCYNYI